MSAAPSFVVVAYDPAWPGCFIDVRAGLRGFFGEAVAIEHIGSTAVPGLAAKPVIDVLLGAGTLGEIELRVGALRAAGWNYVPEHEDELPMRRYFVRPAGATPRINLHAVVLGSTFGASIWRSATHCARMPT